MMGIRFPELQKKKAKTIWLVSLYYFPATSTAELRCPQKTSVRVFFRQHVFLLLSKFYRWPSQIRTRVKPESESRKIMFIKSFIE